MRLAKEMEVLHARICRALADPKRLLIIDTLRHGEMSVGDICDQLDLPQSNVSQHLAILRNKGLVTSRRDAQWIYYSLASPKLIEALDLLHEVVEDTTTP